MQENTDNKADSYSQEKEKLAREIEAIKKRQRFLKILAIVLFITVFASILSVYFIYKKFSPLINFNENISKDYVESKNFFSETQLPPLHPSSTIQQNLVVSPEQSSLSKIGFSKDIIENLSDAQTMQEIDESVEKYRNDPDVKKLFDEMKKDPEFKELFANPSNPMQVFSKMKDPKVMDKYFRMIMSNPKMLSAIMKMAQEPSFQKVLRKHNTVVNSSFTYKGKSQPNSNTMPKAEKSGKDN